LWSPDVGTAAGAATVSICQGISGQFAGDTSFCAFKFATGTFLGDNYDLRTAMLFRIS
jgi:hypothetical protein